MDILIGTTNPAKTAHFSAILGGYGARLLTLSGLGIADEPTENGRTPEENAAIKARFYGRCAENVFCGDAGLYFDALALDDPRQPGLHIRRPFGERLDDAAMIEHYSRLVRELGGRALAYYLDGVALLRGGELFTLQMTREEARSRAFWMVDTPCAQRRPGWPLDSLSWRMDGTSFMEEARQKSEAASGYDRRLAAFLKEHLGEQRTFDARSV